MLTSGCDSSRLLPAPRTAKRSIGTCASLALLLTTACLLPGCTITTARQLALVPSQALEHPQETRIGRQTLDQASAHDGRSGYSLLNVGMDGLATRVQMIRAAERTLDLQYYIFRGDETGRLIADELRRAAARGVRVRVLVDDGDTVRGDEKILQLDGSPNIQVRVFNPFDYRGHNGLLRSADFMLHKARLDYRMHNKLLIADNAVALIGGRNIGNQYFQVDPSSQFADDDLFVAGPMVQSLSGSFDTFWNSDIVTPAAPLAAHASSNATPRVPVDVEADYRNRIDSGEPYASLIDGRRPLEWATARLVYDSPDKRRIEQRQQAGSLMSAAVEARIAGVQNDLLMTTPYFVPSQHEIDLLHAVRARGGHVSVLSNSLESAPALSAQSGYDKLRVPLLENDIRLFEVRARQLGTKGTGQGRRISKYGNYALHAKLYVFDRSSFFIGSWNYDQRSLLINTEVGLLVDDTVLAAQVAKRFDALTSPAAAYALFLSKSSDGAPRVAWRSEEQGHPVELQREPSRGWWQRQSTRLLALLPLQPEL